MFRHLRWAMLVARCCAENCGVTVRAGSFGVVVGKRKDAKKFYRTAELFRLAQERQQYSMLIGCWSARSIATQPGNPNSAWFGTHWLPWAAASPVQWRNVASNRWQNINTIRRVLEVFVRHHVSKLHSLDP